MLNIFRCCDHFRPNQTDKRKNSTNEGCGMELGEKIIETTNISDEDGGADDEGDETTQFGDDHEGTTGWLGLVAPLLLLL